MSRPGAPLTRQRSAWILDDRDEIMPVLTAAGCEQVAVYTRNVHDGHLRAIVSRDPPELGWHLSVSHWPTSERRARRYPNWDELAHARYELLPNDIDVVMHLPPPEQFVSVEDTTFHLHEVLE